VRRSKRADLFRSQKHSPNSSALQQQQQQQPQKAAASNPKRANQRLLAISDVHFLSLPLKIHASKATSRKLSH